MLIIEIKSAILKSSSKTTQLGVNLRRKISSSILLNRKSRIESEKSLRRREQTVDREVENLNLLKTLLCYRRHIEQRLKPTLSGTSEFKLSLPHKRLFSEYNSNHMLKVKVKQMVRHV